jgi:hypothetical protein
VIVYLKCEGPYFNSATHKNEQRSIKHLIFVSALRPPRSSGVTVASVTIPIQKRDRPLNRSPLILREPRARETDQPNANSIRATGSFIMVQDRDSRGVSISVTAWVTSSGATLRPRMIAHAVGLGGAR